jgi:hypothetical protein
MSPRMELLRFSESLAAEYAKLSLWLHGPASLVGMTFQTSTLLPFSCYPSPRSRR